MTRRTRRLALGCAALCAFALVAPQAGAGRASSTTPKYVNYHEPGENDGSGEPSIGVSWKTGTVMYQ